MQRIGSTSYNLLTAVLVLTIQLLIISPVLAQDTNTTSAQNRNNTKSLVDLKNHTISIIDTTTNETMSVKKFPPKAPLNMTTDQNIITNTNNATIDENLIPENIITNETLTNTGNTTTTVNLTDKFSALQGK